MGQEQRDFKGVWIPKEIWLNTELTMLEKVIYTEIDSLDNTNHCTAGNDYFATFCNCSESAVTKAIKHLQDLNLVKIVSFDGRRRTIRINKTTTVTRQTSKIYSADEQNLRCINIDNNLIKKSLLDKSNKDNVKTDSKVLIETFISMYNSMCTNLPKCIKSTPKRDKAILNIVNKFNSYQIQQCFTLANDSSFLTGKNDTGWKANIDFFLREDKFVSTLEGMYGGKQKVTSKAGTDIGLNLNRVADKQQIREDIQNGKAEKF